MEIRELSYFTEVVERASITRAAEAIGISQPALTKCMRLMEDRLGIKLLERSTNGVTPTMYGEALYARAKSILAELSRARADIDELSGKNSGILSIGVLPSQATNLLPLAVVRLLEASPEARMRVFEKSRGDLLSSLRRGEFDLVVSVMESPSAASDLTQIPLTNDRPTVIVRRDHPAVKTGNPGLADLVSFPWLMPPAEAARRWNLEMTFDRLGLALPAAMIECRSVPFMKAVVAQSDYVGLLPDDALTVEEKGGLIKSIFLKNMPAERSTEDEILVRLGHLPLRLSGVGNSPELDPGASLDFPSQRAREAQAVSFQRPRREVKTLAS